MPKSKESNDMTFAEIADRHGEDAAIDAGIASDHDAFELDDDWFKRARPAVQVDPPLVDDPKPVISSEL